MYKRGGGGREGGRAVRGLTSFISFENPRGVWCSQHVRLAVFNCLWNIVSARVLVSVYANTVFCFAFFFVKLHALLVTEEVASVWWAYVLSCRRRYRRLLLRVPSSCVLRSPATLQQESKHGFVKYQPWIRRVKTYKKDRRSSEDRARQLKFNEDVIENPKKT